MNALRIFAVMLLALGLAALPGRLPSWAAEQANASAPPLLPAEEAALRYVHGLSLPPDSLSMEAAAGSSATEAAYALARKFMNTQGIAEGCDPQTAVCTAVGACSIPLRKDDPDFFLEQTVAFNAAFKESLILLAEQIEAEKRADIAVELSWPKQEQIDGTHAVPSLNQLAEHAANSENDAPLLAQAGIDLKTWKEKTPTQKQALARDVLARRIARLTLLDLCGALPIQAFWGTNGDTQSIAVVSLYSPELAQALHTLAAAKQETPAHITADELDSLLPVKEPARMTHLTGPRLLYLQEGPAVAAFGQWMQSYAGKNSGIAEKYRMLAQEQADKAAEEMLKEFLGRLAPPAGADLERAVNASLSQESAAGIDIETLVRSHLQQARALAATMELDEKTLIRWSGGEKEKQNIAGSVALVPFPIQAKPAEPIVGTPAPPAIMINLFSAESDFDLNGALVSGKMISDRISQTVGARLAQSGKFTLLRRKPAAANSQSIETEPLPVESVSTDDGPRHAAMDGVVEGGFRLSPPEQIPDSEQAPDTSALPDASQPAAPAAKADGLIPDNALVLQGAVSSVSFNGKPRISVLTGGALKPEKAKLILDCEVQTINTGMTVWSFTTEYPMDIDADATGSTLFKTLDSLGADMALSIIEMLNPARISAVNGETVRLDIAGETYAPGETLSVYEENRDAAGQDPGLSPILCGISAGTIEVTGSDNSATLAAYSGKNMLKPGMICRRAVKGNGKSQTPDHDGGGVIIPEGGGVKLPFD